MCDGGACVMVVRACTHENTAMCACVGVATCVAKGWQPGGSRDLRLATCQQ